MEKIKLFLLQAALPFAETLMRAFGVMYQTQCLNSAGLAVTSGAAVTYKIANTIFVMVNGILTTKTTVTGPVLTGYNLTSAQVGAVVPCIDVAGTVTNQYAAPAASLGALQLPVIPQGLAPLGLIVINTAATFTGNTTAMDTAGITYINQVGPFNPLNQF